MLRMLPLRTGQTKLTNCCSSRRLVPFFWVQKMNKLAVLVLSCLVTLVVVDLAKAQILRRGCFSHSNCANAASCCQPACPAPCCVAECRPACNACPANSCDSSRSCCREPRRRGCLLGRRSLQCQPAPCPPAPCPCPPEPMMSLAVPSPYSACCYDCQTACGSGYTAACQAYCRCKYGNPPGTNCEALRPACY